jgi:hypothetical protein
MQGNECGVLLSASDLMRFAGCAHATTLDLAWTRGTGAAPVGDREDAALLQGRRIVGRSVGSPVSVEIALLSRAGGSVPDGRPVFACPCTDAERARLRADPCLRLDLNPQHPVTARRFVLWEARRFAPM